MHLAAIDGCGDCENKRNTLPSVTAFCFGGYLSFQRAPNRNYGFQHKVPETFADTWLKWCSICDVDALPLTNSRGTGQTDFQSDGQNGEAPQEGGREGGGRHVGSRVPGEDQPLLLRWRELQLRLLQVSER